MSKADLIMHPVRLRLLRALSAGPQTAQQLLAGLDVAQATLYRHLNTLEQHNLIVVVEERPVRGTVEKVYGLGQPEALSLSADALASVSKDDHLRYFLTFLVMVLSDFEQYLQRTAQPDLLADGVGYRQVDLNVSDAEFMAMVQALNQALQPFLGLAPAPERRRRRLSTIVMPVTGDDQGADDDSA